MLRGHERNRRGARVGSVGSILVADGRNGDSMLSPVADGIDPTDRERPPAMSFFALDPGARDVDPESGRNLKPPAPRSTKAPNTLGESKRAGTASRPCRPEVTSRRAIGQKATVFNWEGAPALSGTEPSARGLSTVALIPRNRLRGAIGEPLDQPRGRVVRHRACDPRSGQRRRECRPIHANSASANWASGRHTSHVIRLGDRPAATVV